MNINNDLSTFNIEACNAEFEHFCKLHDIESEFKLFKTYKSRHGLYAIANGCKGGFGSESLIETD